MARWGFAALLVIGCALAVWIGATVDVPDELPSYALQAAPVYRLEIGGAFFSATYGASLAFVLALENRGFTELSASGVKAPDLRGITQDEVIEQHAEMLEELAASIAELKSNTEPDKRLDRR